MQGRARQFAGRGSRVLFTAFHEAGFNQKLVLSPVLKPAVVLPKNNSPRVFHVAKLEDVGSEVEASEKKRQSCGSAFSEQLCESALFDTMHESVRLVRTGRKAWKRGRVDLNTAEFNISPGKMTFLSGDSRNGDSTTFQLEPNCEGEISESQVQRFGLRPFFNPFLKSCMLDKVTEVLQEDGFVCLNPENPDQYTIVHLETDEQRERFSVTLTKDEDFQNGVESKGAAESPKVISVKTKKKKISNITLFADKALDLRASLTVYEEDLGNLTYHVHDVLMAAWEQRDPEGGIEIPGPATGVRVDMVKQVTSANTWAKDVEDAMVEVTTKVMRLKQRLNTGRVTEWEECLEIDVRIQDVELHPDALTDFILKVKTLFQNIATESSISTTKRD